MLDADVRPGYYAPAFVDCELTSYLTGRPHDLRLVLSFSYPEKVKVLASIRHQLRTGVLQCNVKIPLLGHVDDHR